jgi:hypothetical protein
VIANARDRARVIKRVRRHLESYRDPAWRTAEALASVLRLEIQIVLDVLRELENDAKVSRDEDGALVAWRTPASEFTRAKKAGRPSGRIFCRLSIAD